MSARAVPREVLRFAHEAECRELETENLRRRAGRWYVKRGESWRPLDPPTHQPEAEQKS